MESTNVAPGFEQKTRTQQEESSAAKTQEEERSPRSIRPNSDEKEYYKSRREIYRHPEGKVARPHRCNDRLEDLIQALFEGNPRKNLPGPARLFYRCLQSNPGEEPSEPFSYLKIDPPGKKTEAASE